MLLQSVSSWLNAEKRWFLQRSKMYGNTIWTIPVYQSYVGNQRNSTLIMVREHSLQAIRILSSHEEPVLDLEFCLGSHLIPSFDQKIGVLKFLVVVILFSISGPSRKTGKCKRQKVEYFAMYRKQRKIPGRKHITFQLFGCMRPSIFLPGLVKSFPPKQQID